MLELIKTYEQLVQNVKSFNADLEKGCLVLLDRLSMFRCWYYIDELGLFAPSKYVGYCDMNCATYAESFHTADGRETEAAMHRMFHVKIAPPSYGLELLELFNRIRPGTQPNRLHRVFLVSQRK